jgi:hypothetical protein
VESRIGCGDATINRGLEQDFFYFFSSYAVVYSAAHVYAEFVGAVEGDHHR